MRLGRGSLEYWIGRGVTWSENGRVKTYTCLVSLNDARVEAITGGLAGSIERTESYTVTSKAAEELESDAIRRYKVST